MDYRLMLLISDNVIQGYDIDGQEYISIEGNRELVIDDAGKINLFCDYLKEFYNIDTFDDIPLKISVVNVKTPRNYIVCLENQLKAVDELEIINIESIVAVLLSKKILHNPVSINILGKFYNVCTNDSKQICLEEKEVNGMGIEIEVPDLLKWNDLSEQINVIQNIEDVKDTHDSNEVFINLQREYDDLKKAYFDLKNNKEYHKQKIKELNNLKVELEAEILLKDKELDIDEDSLIREIDCDMKNRALFFFKNKPYLVFDRETGYMWAHPKCPQCYKEELSYYKKSEILNIIDSDTICIDGLKGWKIPTYNELYKVNTRAFDGRMYSKIDDFHSSFQNKYRSYTFDNCALVVRKLSGCCFLERDYDEKEAALIPVNKTLICDTDYSRVMESPIKTQEEKYMYIVKEIFVKNGLVPEFIDDKLTDQFEYYYFGRAEILKEIQKIEKEIAQEELVLNR